MPEDRESVDGFRALTGCLKMIITSLDVNVTACDAFASSEMRMLGIGQIRLWLRRGIGLGHLTFELVFGCSMSILDQIFN